MLLWLTKLFCAGFVAHLLWLCSKPFFEWVYSLLSRYFQRIASGHICEHCSTVFGLDHEESRTMYHWEGEGEDPNRSLLLCRQCAILHHDFWDEMWDQYNAGRL